MKIFTVGNGTAKLGAKVSIVGNNVEIFAICVGEVGRGRKLGYIPIGGIPNTTTVTTNVVITNVVISQTRIGFPKFTAITPETDTGTGTEECVVVFRHTGGFRGGAELTGDRVDFDNPALFRDFPGKILQEGIIAQGAAGRMGGNSQYIARIRRGQVFRIKRWGKLYGNPSSYYGCFDDGKITLVTWEDREALDLWFD
jgi:hypothetical protein